MSTDTKELRDYAKRLLGNRALPLKASAVLELAAAELDALRAEVERLKARVEAAKVIAGQHCSECPDIGGGMNHCGKCDWRKLDATLAPEAEKAPPGIPTACEVLGIPNEPPLGTDATGTAVACPECRRKP